MKKELKIDYTGQICQNCKHEIIGEGANKAGTKIIKLKHLKVCFFGNGKTIIITISDDCECGCKNPKD